ncbi:MAG: 30S ribosome-binding factor RbfA [Deltaproteobacteria bacterium]|nr:30S ribosome-binding factor RbfA [Deltaproteobacteria bacterium]
MAKQRRVHRVAEKVRETVALELQRLADPRFTLVTITSVVASADLRNVKVYWMVSGGPERRKEVQAAFESAGGIFKRVIGHDLGIRFVPELHFFYDDTLDTDEEVRRLFEKVHAHDASAAADASDGQEDSQN